jgi:hydroxypyruvate isomerase
VSHCSHANSIKAQLHSLALGERGTKFCSEIFRDAFRHDVLNKKAFAAAVGCQPAHVFPALTNKPRNDITRALSQLGFGNR